MSSINTSTQSQFNNQAAVGHIHSALSSCKESTFDTGWIHGLIEGFLSCGAITSEQAQELDGLVRAKFPGKPQDGNHDVDRVWVEPRECSATTQSRGFNPITPNRINLFQVAPGVPVVNVLEEVSCLLDSTINVCVLAADKGGNGAIYGAITLCEAAKAALDSANSAILAANNARGAK